MSEHDALQLLALGELDVEGRLVDASNATLYCAVSLDGATAGCVYKPVRGERPLWDFPTGTLADREVAAYLVSAATGWAIVPPTVMRDGPFGTGMCQLWMDPDPTVDLVALARSDHPDLRRMAVFDAVVNNADRKGGHLLPQEDGHVYGCDHGVCFHVEDKLRTLLWGWAGDPLTREASDVLTDLREQLDGALGAELAELLSSAEIAATRRRIRRLLKTGCHPQPSGEWPAVPWPPF
ncbi:MAG: SCO1664 family protein [Mycobacteriales bacterium]